MCIWSGYKKLEQEFFAQGDRDEDMGASTKSPLMDRDKAGTTKSQCGFFQVVVVPLFKSFKSAFPSAEPIMENLQNNMDLWQKIEEDQLEISEVFRVWWEWASEEENTHTHNMMQMKLYL